MFTALFWKEAWVWLKNYWYWPVIATLFLITLLGGSRLRSKFFDLLFKQRESYDKEIQTLRRTAEEKEEKVQEVVESHTEELRIIEEEHEIKVNELEKKKQDELIEMVKENKDKPDKLAAELARILSAEYYRKNR